MTDTVSRQAVIDAIEGERLTDATGHDGDIGYNQALDDALAAVKAIPAVTVTDDMVERGVNAYGWKPGDNQMRMKAALVATLGE